jgi:hypothetical protein
MKITIEPSKDQRGETYPYSKVSVEYPHDDVDIETMMGEVVKVIQAWGFDNTNIAEYLDEEFAKQRGLITPYEVRFDKGKIKMEFEEWLEKNEEELGIMFAETGMDRELDFNPEDEFEKQYEKYLKE